MTRKPPPASRFAALADLRDRLPAGEPPVAAPAAPARGPARAVVRYERKGRGGKEATLVEKLDLLPADLEAWCRDLLFSLRPASASPRVLPRSALRAPAPRLGRGGDPQGAHSAAAGASRRAPSSWPATSAAGCRHFSGPAASAASP